MATFMKEARVAAGLRIESVSSKAGIRFKTMVMVEEGDVHVTHDVAQRIMSAIETLKAEREAA